MASTLQAKYIAANALNTFLPLQYLFRRLKNRYIFAYHRVVPHSKAIKYRMQQSMWISPETFSSDLHWMSEHGEIVDLDTILDFTHQNTRPLFSITFDDGWVDNYEYALPALNHYSAPATVFLVTRAVETGNLFWVEDFLYKISMFQDLEPGDNILPRLHHCATKHNLDIDVKHANTQTTAELIAESLKPMEKGCRDIILLDIYKTLGLSIKPLTGEILTWEQIRKMHRLDIEFGSHTNTHEILQYINDDACIDELETSKRTINERLHTQIRYFCYPNARYNTSSPEYVKSSGYSYAFRIHNLPVTHNSDRYLIPRFLLNEAVCINKNYLMCKLLKFPKF